MRAWKPLLALLVVGLTFSYDRSFAQTNTNNPIEGIDSIVLEYSNFLKEANSAQQLQDPAVRNRWIQRFEGSLSKPSSFDSLKYTSLAELYEMNGDYKRAYAANNRIVSDENAQPNQRLQAAFNQLSVAQRAHATPEQVLAHYDQLESLASTYRQANVSIDPFFQWFSLSIDFQKAIYLTTAAENALLKTDPASADRGYMEHMNQAKTLLQSYVEDYDPQDGPYKEYNSTLEQADIGRSAALAQIVEIAGKLQPVYKSKNLLNKANEAREEVVDYSVEFLKLYPKNKKRSGLIGQQLLQAVRNEVSPAEYLEITEFVMDNVSSTQGFVDFELNRTIEEWSGQAETVNYANQLLDMYIERYKEWYPDKYMALNQYHWFYIAKARNYLDFGQWDKFHETIQEIEKFSLSDHFNQIIDSYLKASVDKQWGVTGVNSEFLRSVENSIENEIKTEDPNQTVFIPLLEAANSKHVPFIYDLNTGNLTFAEKDAGVNIKLDAAELVWNGKIMVSRSSNVFPRQVKHPQSEWKVEEKEGYRSYYLPTDLSLPIELIIQTKTEGLYGLKILKVKQNGIYAKTWHVQKE